MYFSSFHNYNDMTEKGMNAPVMLKLISKVCQVYHKACELSVPFSGCEWHILLFAQPIS